MAQRIVPSSSLRAESTPRSSRPRLRRAALGGRDAEAAPSARPRAAPLGPVSLGCVTGERAQAYGRVVETLDDLSAGKLRPAEQRIVREAADALFFCEDLASDLAAREARAALHGLSGNLVESDRLLPETAAALVSDVEGCGPLAPVG
jgi:hypothetical protein